MKSFFSSFAGAILGAAAFVFLTRFLDPYYYYVYDGEGGTSTDQDPESSEE